MAFDASAFMRKMVSARVTCCWPIWAPINAAAIAAGSISKGSCCSRTEPTPPWLTNTCRHGRNASARRHRLLAAIIVKAAIGLTPEPAGLDVFHQQRTRPIFRVGQPLVQYLHHRQARIEPDEIGELERTHRVVRAKAHRSVDAVNGANALVQRIDRLVDHRQQNAVYDKG